MNYYQPDQPGAIPWVSGSAGNSTGSMPSCMATGIVSRSVPPIGVKPNVWSGSGIDQLETRASVPTANSRTYAALDVETAIRTYAVERRAQVSKRMVAYWLENAKPLAAFFKETKLRQIAPTQLAEYQNARTDAGRAPKTINGELSVLRQVLKRARLWYVGTRRSRRWPRRVCRIG